MNDYTFGNFLYELRTQKGLSQAELGELMGVSNKAVSKWEMGAAKPRPAMLLALASFFGVTVEELLAGKRLQEPVRQEGEGDELSSAIAVQMREYRRARNKLYAAVLITVLSPFALFAALAVAEALDALEAGWTMGVTLGLLALGILSFVLIWVFLASARRQKRLIYACYPARRERLNEPFHPKPKQETQKEEEDFPATVRRLMRLQTGYNVCYMFVALVYTAFFPLLAMSKGWREPAEVLEIVLLFIGITSYLVGLSIFLRANYICKRSARGAELKGLLNDWKRMTRGQKALFCVCIVVWTACMMASMLFARTQVLTGVPLMIAGFACGEAALAAFFTMCGMLFVIRRRTRKKLQKNLGQND